ncbi:hypothetical protein J2T16_005582 [Paenibacillus intestini]|nr:hypothetical protein [Paenibacillus intestini]
MNRSGAGFDGAAHGCISDCWTVDDSQPPLAEQM